MAVKEIQTGKSLNSKGELHLVCLRGFEFKMRIEMKDCIIQIWKNGVWSAPVEVQKQKKM